MTYWDTSRVKDMTNLSRNLWAKSLGLGSVPFRAKLKGIERWNTAQVERMDGMFAGSKFDQDIGGWDVRRVQSMKGMFKESTFNRPLSWDTRNVTDMSEMFEFCRAFNQQLAFDTSRVTRMRRMFAECSAFNRDISSWAVGRVIDDDRIFDSCPIQESHQPRTGLTVIGPNATQLRDRLMPLVDPVRDPRTRMRVICIDIVSSETRVTINKAMMEHTMKRPETPEVAYHARNVILEFVCKERGRATFNWVAPLSHLEGWSCRKNLTVVTPENGDKGGGGCTVQ